MRDFDVAILGAGAAGMLCGIQAGRRGRRVAILERNPKAGRKILISGGGRCNFTNVRTSPAEFVSENPNFCTSALTRFTPEDFIRMVQEHRICFHEKKLGQLFCDHSAQEIVDMLLEECRKAGVEVFLNSQIQAVEKSRRFTVRSAQGDFSCESVVVATGGLSIPKLGASDLGYRIARQFELHVVDPAPALDGFVFREEGRKHFKTLAGVSLDAAVTCRGASFRENILFTHSGLSGPAALQASLYWRPGDPVEVDLVPSLPGEEFLRWLLEKRTQGVRAQLKNVLGQLLPKSFCETFCQLYSPTETPLSQLSNAHLKELCQRLHAWTFIPERTVGYQRAEVTRGGVATEELSSKTMEAKKVPGLYFIGEVVDVTGWLGGYNFQWAWASGWVAGQYA